MRREGSQGPFALLSVQGKLAYLGTLASASECTGTLMEVLMTYIEDLTLGELRCPLL